MSGGAHTRILFNGVDSEIGEAEVLWAGQLTEDTFRLDNIPLLVFDVSMGDAVQARGESAPYVFTRVVGRGGHSTYRVMLKDPDHARTRARFRELVSLGCGYEELTPRFIAIDVPPDVDVFKVYALFERGQDDGTWAFEEGHCGHDTA